MNTSQALSVTAVPFGDSAVMLSTPGGSARADIIELRGRLLARRLPGVVDVVSGLESLLIEFDPLESSAEQVELAARLLAEVPADAGRGGDADASSPVRAPHRFDVPVVFDEETGPDLAAVAVEVGLEAAEVVRRIAGSTFTIALLGAAMAPMMDGLDLPRPVRRSTTPRTDVVPGSVMIAGSNAIIQPFPGPSGWRVVGRTPKRIVDIERDEPVSFAPGDTVRFVPVPRGEAEGDAHGGFLLPSGDGPGATGPDDAGPAADSRAAASTETEARA